MDERSYVRSLEERISKLESFIRSMSFSGENITLNGCMVESVSSGDGSTVNVNSSPVGDINVGGTTAVHLENCPVGSVLSRDDLCDYSDELDRIHERVVGLWDEIEEVWDKVEKAEEIWDKVKKAEKKV